MVDPESFEGYTRQEFEIDGQLLERLSAIAEQKGWSRSKCFSSGFALLQAWVRYRDLSTIHWANFKTLSILDFAVDDPDSGTDRTRLLDIADMVDMEKQTYTSSGARESVLLSEELRLNLELYAFSQSYDAIDPVFRDAALFFCNVHELIEQGRQL